MARNGNALEVVPTTPITKALVRPPLVLRELVEKLAVAEGAGGGRLMLELCRAYANHLKDAQDVAEKLACEIERRLRVVEGAAKDVVGATGNIVRLTDETPLPVSSINSVGIGLAAAREDHTHEGVHTVAAFVGDITVSGNVVPAANNLHFPPSSTTILQEEVPTGTIDGSNDTFELTGSPTVLILVQNGVILEGGGNDYTLNGNEIVYVPGKVPFVGDHHWAYWSNCPNNREEVPSGVIDGANDTFQLLGSKTFVLLMQNMVTLEAGGNDFTRTGDTFVYVPGKIPQVGDRHLAIWSDGTGPSVEETPSGVIDGANDTFGLSPSACKFVLVQSGARLEEGEDYTLTGDTIVYVAGKIPPAGSHHWGYWLAV